MTIDLVIDYLRRHLDETDITLNQGASDESIEQFEKSTGIILPDDVKQFYRFANGFESEEYLFNIVPLEYIVDSETGNIYIAEYSIYADMWQLEINPANANDYLITTMSAKDERIVLTNSFAELLSRFLKEGLIGEKGLCAWANEVDKI